jgi:L-fuconolactonase
MIVDTHVHVVSNDKVRHPLAPGATGWSTEVTNPVEDLIAAMDSAGVDRATLVQPVGTYALDNSYQVDSANQFADRTVSVGILDPVAEDAADKLTYWVSERGMQGVRLVSQADADDERANPIWTRAQELGIPISVAGGGQPDRIDKIRAMATRFPGVIVAPDHMAGWSNATEQREEMTKALVELAGLPNAYLRISTTSLGLYDSLDESEKDMFKRVLDALTPQRVMWGSNFPGSREGGYGALVELGKTALPFLSNDDRNWILGDTALTLWPSLKGPAN